MKKGLLRGKRKWWLLPLVIVYLYVQNTWVEVEKIQVEIKDLPDRLVAMKIAHLSDLHIPQNGPSIDTIVSKVKSEGPDIIVITGDIVDKRQNFDLELFEKFCENIAKVAPTYVVTGNHEMWSGNLQTWKRVLKANNIMVVDGRTHIINHNGEELAVIGIKDGESFSSEDIDPRIEDLPKILLSHRSDGYLSGMKDNDLIKPNIVFSGHIHGGQFIIPFTKIGVLSPNVKFFPKYISGMYKLKEGISLVMSRGLGNSIIPFRINNRPHLLIIELQGGKTSDIIK